LVALVLMGHVNIALLIAETADVSLSLLDDFGEVASTGTEGSELLLSNHSASLDGGGEALGNHNSNIGMVIISNCQSECSFG
jgi:hypothetical protein